MLKIIKTDYIIVYIIVYKRIKFHDKKSKEISKLNNRIFITIGR